jgi:hypothetical protein
LIGNLAGIWLLSAYKIGKNKRLIDRRFEAKLGDLLGRLGGWIVGSKNPSHTQTSSRLFTKKFSINKPVYNHYSSAGNLTPADTSSTAPPKSAPQTAL